MSESDGELSVGVPSPVCSNGNNYQSRIDARRMEMDDGSSSDESQSTIHSKNELSGNVGQDSSGSGANHRNPTCALCRNHQKISSLKGHKRYCPWRHCLCELCYSTNKKREINAKQVLTFIHLKSR